MFYFVLQCLSWIHYCDVYKIHFQFTILVHCFQGAIRENWDCLDIQWGRNPTKHYPRIWSPGSVRQNMLEECEVKTWWNFGVNHKRARIEQWGSKWINKIWQHFINTFNSFLPCTWFYSCPCSQCICKNSLNLSPLKDNL